MTYDFMKLERVLGKAEAKLLRQTTAWAWLIQYYDRTMKRHPRSHRRFKTAQLRLSGYPGYIPHNKLNIVYCEVTDAVAATQTLVLRLRALKYHGHTRYIDPQYTHLPYPRNFDVYAPIGS